MLQASGVSEDYQFYRGGKIIEKILRTKPLKTKEKNCKERINKELEKEIETIKTALKNGYSHDLPEDSEIDHSETADGYQERLLSVDTYTVKKVCMSWGGPADYFEFHIKDGEFIKITYIFQDWFDGAEVALEGDNFDTVAEMYFWLLED